MAFLNQLRLSRSGRLTCIALLVGLLLPTQSSAQELTAPAAAPPPDAAMQLRLEQADRAEFNGGRLAVEMLVSAVGGSLAGYVTYKEICNAGP